MMNVLVIEDNLFDFCIFDEMLKKSVDPAVQLTHCYQLSEGLREIERGAYDLILLDLNLPGSKGLETFAEVYRCAALIPIIVISALDSAELAVQAVKSGAQDYLVKGKLNSELLLRSMRYAVERKRMEVALNNANDRYRSIFDGVNDAIMAVNRKGRIVDANASACKLYGFTREKLLSRHISDIVPAEYMLMLASDTAELKAKVPEYTIEAENIRANGQRFAVEMSLNAYPVNNETVSLLVVRDISQRKQAEEAYRALVDRSLQELYIVQDNRIVFANPAAIHNTGFSLEELQKFSPEEILYGAQAGSGSPPGTPARRRRAAQPTPSRHEFRRIRKDGTVGWASTLVTSIQYQGRPANQIALLDVTERIQAVEAYRLLVEQSLQELLIFRDGRIVFANPAAVHNSGFEPEELLSLQAEELRRAVIHPEDRSFFEEGQRVVLAGERDPVLQEMRAMNKDGKTRWVETLSTRIEYQGRPCIQTVQFDITERRQAEERLHYRHSIETLIANVSTGFINLTSERIDAGIRQALQSLGKFVGCDRAFVCLLSSDGSRFEEGYEWCAGGVPARLKSILGTSFEPYRWSLEKFKNREAVKIACLQDLSEQAAAERAALEAENIQSLLAMPLVLNNMLFGLWGFISLHSPEAWAEENISLLRMMGDVFVNALARKQSEQALRRARQELDQVINSVSDALWTAEVDCKTGCLEYRYISPVIERITGRTTDYFKLACNPWTAIVHPEDRGRVEESLDRTWKERAGLVKEEYRIVMPGGQVRWVRDSRSVSESRSGRVRLDAVLSDITERKQAEEAYRLLVERSLQELLIFQDGRIVFANPAAVHNSGFEPEELLGLSAEEAAALIHPDDREEVQRASLARLAGQRVPDRQEYRIFRKDGSMRWLESLSICIEYQGRAAIQSAQLDITERKLAEECLKHRIEIEEMVTTLSTGFINLSIEEVDSHIRDALQAIGKFTGVDLCYLDLISPGGQHVQRRYRWAAEGIPARGEEVGGFDLGPFRWSLERLRRLESVYVPRMDDLPPEAAAEKSFWQALERRSVLNIPLVLNEELLGYLGFASNRLEKEWAEEDIRLLQLMGDVFINVLARKNAEEALIESEAQYRLLADSISDIVALHEIDGGLVYISPSVHSLFGAPPLDILDKDILTLLHPDDLPVTEDLYARLLQKKDHLVQLRVRNAEGAYVWIEARLHLIERDGKPYQILSTSRVITERKQAEQALYEANQRLQSSIGEMERRNHEVMLMNELGDLLQGCLNLQDLYDVVASMAPHLFLGEAGALYIQDSSRKQVEAAKTWGDHLMSEPAFKPENCWALRRGRPHSVYLPEPDLACKHVNSPDPISYVCIPMTAHGETLGSFYQQCLNTDGNGLRCKSLATMVATRVALAIANLRLRETLQRQSIHDSLTGLFNRRYMETTVERELRQAQRQNHSVGFIMIDIDHLKHFNDSYGHGAGDALLAALGEYLRTNIRDSDIACRYGGDEFALILPQTTLEETTRRAEELREGLKRITVSYRGATLGPVTASLGVSAYPDHAAIMDRLLSLADVALYHAKGEGRDRVNIADQKDWEHG